MGLKFIGEIRDPIHGLIPFTQVEREVIDTLPFQRLRGIKQLALANLGFPGANHTRFEHSIGVMYVAWKIAEHLKSSAESSVSDDELQIIRLAGLLHDIGHGPFSHVSEELLKRHYEESGRQDEIHEEISRRIITDNEELTKVLGKDMASRIVQLLSTELKQPDFKHDIVSGPIDADKMDYLLRDSYYTGVKYGVFDIDRLTNVMTVAQQKAGSRLAIKYEGLETVEQYVMAKYFISRQVYQHRVRRITDLMIVEGISGLIQSGVEELRKLYTYSQDPSFPSMFIQFEDHTIVDMALKNESRYFQLLKKRCLFKELFTEKLKDLMKGILSDTNRLEKLQKNDTNEVVERIANLAKPAIEFTYVRAYSLKTPSPFMRDSLFDKESVWIKFPDGSVFSLYDKSDLFSNLTKDAETYRVSVYGLLNKQSETANQSLERSIKQALRDYLGGS